MLASYQTLYLNKKVPKKCECLVYGFIKVVLRNNCIKTNMPDDIKRICLLYYYSVAEHFISIDKNKNKNLLITKKKRLLKVKKTDYYSIDTISSCRIYGNVMIEPFQNKKYYWKFKVSITGPQQSELIKIGIYEAPIVSPSGNTLSGREFWGYCNNGQLYSHNKSSRHFGLQYGHLDVIHMELNFINSSFGILSFSRGIQLLKVACYSIPRDKDYKMFVDFKPVYIKTEIELLQFAEYYPSHSVASWDKICGFCQKPNATKRCSACKVVYYCNKKHQKEHWRYQHKKKCKLYRKKMKNASFV